jgi:hypothetical protein
MNHIISQNIIAVIWDFDKTLIPNYMQTPLFKKYQIDETKFWKETELLKSRYKKAGIRVNPDTIYLNHILTYVEQGIFEDLNNEVLKSLGKEIEFFQGLPDFFEATKQLMVQNKDYAAFDLKLEHYIVSTGLTEMIKGSAIAPYVEEIWGCEFIEEPLIPVGDDLIVQTKTDQKRLSSIAYSIDNTTKTRAVFEINKGVNKYEEVSVNQSMREEDRRVPFENMIYVADGPSDVPAFSVVKKGGGKTFAVYQQGKSESFRQAKRLLEDQRVDMFGEADYRNNTTTYMWMTEQICEIADRIVNTKKAKLREGNKGVPKHII